MLQVPECVRANLFASRRSARLERAANKEGMLRLGNIASVNGFATLPGAHLSL
jgi:hypothetical protein